MVCLLRAKQINCAKTLLYFKLPWFFPVSEMSAVDLLYKIAEESLSQCYKTWPWFKT